MTMSFMCEENCSFSFEWYKKFHECELKEVIYGYTETHDYSYNVHCC